MSISSFRQGLEELINHESMESGSDTPDFILAQYLLDCLLTFDRTIAARSKYYGIYEHGEEGSRDRKIVLKQEVQQLSDEDLSSI